MKKCEKVLDIVREFDLFAPHIGVRYKSDNDFKTLTGAILSLSLIIFFAVVFVNRFTVMIERTEITSSVLLKEETDPSFYNTSTSTFMFAVGLSGVDMNSGTRYFNWYAQATSVVYRKKTKVKILLQPCTVDMWSPLGESFVTLYNKLGFSKWLCPAQDQLIQIQGKYSSDIFRYIKIYLKNCSGTENGQGCKTSDEVANYITANEVFGFNFYFVNSLINPDEINPLSYFLDDTNNFPFSITTGTACNFYVQSYTINTDNSLLPFDEINTMTGGKSPVPAQMTTYTITSSGEYMRFYIRKSPVSEIYTRGFFKFDDLLSYIGGLFGLIAMVIQLPLTYYNICCFELSLATELFTYRKKKDKDDKQKDKDKFKSLKTQQSEGSSPTKLGVSGKIANADNGSGADLCTLQPRDPLSSPNPKEKNKQQREEENSSKEKESLSHSIDKFNFFTYIGYIPFFALKRFGWKSLKSERFTPYYEAIKQVRRQIDLGGIIQRFLYLDRVSKSVLDEDQRKLLHIYPKENIYQMDDHRSGFKLREKIKQSIAKKDIASLLSIIVPEILGEKQQTPTEQHQLRKAYQNLRRRHDRISKRIIENLDPQIVRGLIASDDLQKVNQNSAGEGSELSLVLKDSDELKKQNADSYSLFQPKLKTRRRQSRAESSLNVRTDMAKPQANSAGTFGVQPFEFIDPDNEGGDNSGL